MLKQQVNGDPNTVFILGHDVLGQANGTSNPNYLLYDGHGSVRQLADSAGTVTANYAYDAYGNAHGFNPADAATSMLYTGEWYDNTAQQYYLRARCYVPFSKRLKVNYDAFHYLRKGRYVWQDGRRHRLLRHLANKLF